MGGVSSQKSYLEIVGLADGSQYSQLLIGTINALYYIGVMTGALLIGSISDRIGRRKACVCSGILALVAVAIFTTLQNFSWAVGGRMFVGLATGAFDAVGLNWSAETAKSKRRGLAFGLIMSCAALGASQSYFITYGLSKHKTGEFIWRFTIAFQAIYIMFIMTFSFLLPESPRWLVRVGLYDEAREVLSALTDDDGLPPIEHKKQ
jgi:MFS family permease